MAANMCYPCWTGTVCKPGTSSDTYFKNVPLYCGDSGLTPYVSHVSHCIFTATISCFLGQTHVVSSTSSVNDMVPGAGATSCTINCG